MITRLTILALVTLSLTGALRGQPFSIPGTTVVVSGGSSVDSDAQSFITAAGVSNLVGQTRLDGFVKSMKLYGLWSLAIDAVPLSSLMQPSNGVSLVSMKSRFTTLTNLGAIRGVRGMSFDGVNDLLYGRLDTDLTTFSASVIIQGSTNYTSAAIPGWFGMYNTAASQYHILGAVSGAYDTSYLLTQGDGGGNVGSGLITYDVGGPFRGYTHMDTVRKYVTWAHNTDTHSNTLAFVNGSNNLLTNTLTARTFTVGASTVVLGARYDTGTPSEFAKCNSAGFVIFNSRLTHTQASNLVECMRWLDPAPENLVIAGDSMSRQLDPTATYAFWEGWPSAMELFPSISNRFAIFNNAYNGVAAANFSYALNIAPYAPNRGGVAASTLIIWLGYNDFNGGAMGPTVFTSVNTLAERARADGFRVVVALPPLGATIINGATTLAVSNVLKYHNLILTNRENFDAVVRLDNVFGSHVTNVTATPWQDDGLHPNATGEAAVAQVMAQVLSGVRDVAQQAVFVQTKTNNSTAATDLHSRWQPGNELRTRGDIVRYKFSGGFSNDVIHAKLITIAYGSQTVLSSGNLDTHQGPWSAEVAIQHLTATSQIVESRFTGSATNFSHLVYTTQTNWFPTLVRAIGTGPTSNVLTNEILTVQWEPLR